MSANSKCISFDENLKIWTNTQKRIFSYDFDYSVGNIIFDSLKRYGDNVVHVREEIQNL